MAAVSTSGKPVEPVFPTMAEIYPAECGATVTAGQAVLQNSSGKVVPAAATGAVWGIALQGGGAGQPTSVLVKGHVEGFDVASLDPHDVLYTAASGALADTGTVAIGEVLAMSDGGTLVAYIG